MTDNEKLVASAASAFSDVEVVLNNIPDLIQALRAAIKAAHMNGVGRSGEFLRIDNTLAGVSGSVSSALERVIAVHERSTAIAKREGCDAVLPDGYAIQPRSGGDR